MCLYEVAERIQVCQDRIGLMHIICMWSDLGNPCTPAFKTIRHAKGQFAVKQKLQSFKLVTQYSKVKNIVIICLAPPLWFTEFAKYKYADVFDIVGNMLKFAWGQMYQILCFLTHVRDLDALLPGSCSKFRCGSFLFSKKIGISQEQAEIHFKK